LAPFRKEEPLAKNLVMNDIKKITSADYSRNDNSAFLRVDVSDLAASSARLKPMRARKRGGSDDHIVKSALKTGDTNMSSLIKNDHFSGND